MTTFAHKKMGGRTVQKFLYELQEEETSTLSWKKGPFANNTKLNSVSISHWPRKDTLMSQCPNEATNKLNERLRMTMSDEMKHGENVNKNQQWNGESEMINKKPRTTEKREVENIATIAKNQIDDIMLFSR